MLIPVSATTVGICCIGYAALNAYAQPGSAVSAEAQTVTKAAFDLMRSAEDSQSIFSEKFSSISQLRQLADECSMQGWDGYDAAPIDAIALINAQNFLRALPSGTALPEFAPEPDGSISLDWIQSRYRLFSLSIASSNRLAYAWLDGTDKGYAVAHFGGSIVPQRVLAGIKSIVGDSNAPIRIT
jgi:hypothetical protein